MGILTRAQYGQSYRASCRHRIRNAFNIYGVKWYLKKYLNKLYISVRFDWTVLTAQCVAECDDNYTMIVDDIETDSWLTMWETQSMENYNRLVI